MEQAAGIAVAITTSMAIVGRLTLGVLAERINQRTAAALSLTAQAAALAVLRACERAAIGDLRLLVVPLAAAAATVAARGLASFVTVLVRRRRPRYAPQPSRPSLP